MQCASTARCIDNCADCIRTADRHFAPKNTLHLGNTLLPGTLYSMEHFTSWKWSRVQRILRKKSHYVALCSRELSVPRSRVFQKAKCAEKQSVLGSKVFQGAECSREQNVLRSKMFWGAKYESAKCSQGAKCSGEQSVHQL